MVKILTKLGILVSCIISLPFTAMSKSYLKDCWTKQAGSLKQNYLMLTYKENVNKLEHSFEPWQQTKYFGKGEIWINNSEFLMIDTLNSGGQIYNSKKVVDNNNMLFLDYGDTELFKVTKTMLANQIIENARYSPLGILNFFYKSKVSLKTTPEFAIYTASINKSKITLYINKKTKLILRIDVLSDDDLYGDVTTVVRYNNYSRCGEIQQPGIITITKINDILLDTVNILSSKIVNKAPNILTKPINYKISEDAEIKPVISTNKYDQNIHFIEFNHTEDRVLLVEFKDFLLVAEAPLNSRNGQIIIDQAKKMAPGKPIKFFVFGHHHPHYVGGVRSFVHLGATILATDNNVDYVKYIVEASHKLNPDSLELSPKVANIEIIGDHKTITDGNFQMEIYKIGSLSKHTEDYLIYYFPTMKMLFQDDLAFIPLNGTRKASSRQKGLYDAIKSLNLKVDKIVQSWPIGNYGIKTIFSFNELEESVKKQ